jgi:hypothetical protein
MRHLAYSSRTPMSVESLVRCALASPDVQRGIQPIVWERWAKGNGCQKGMISGLLVYKHLNSTMDHVWNICRIGEAVSTRMLNQHLRFAQPARAPRLARPEVRRVGRSAVAPAWASSLHLGDFIGMTLPLIGVTALGSAFLKKLGETFHR